MPGKNGKNLKKKMNPTKGIKKPQITMKSGKMMGKKRLSKGGRV
tara:strand:- start:626 stop:757 length:132 start_codon:yes stop_codon:yes gene_type:complete